MEIESEINKDDINNEKEPQKAYLVPFIYIKRALLRIWGFLPTGISVCFNSNLYLFILFLVFIYVGIPILLEKRNNQFVSWLKRNGGFKKEFIIKNFNSDAEIL